MLSLWLSEHRRLVVSVVSLLTIVLIGLIGHSFFSPTYGAELGSRSLQLRDSDAGNSTDYEVSLNLSTPGQLGSIKIQFCSNDPSPNAPCTAPAGLDASAATLVDQTGLTGFSISTASTANQIILTRSQSPAGIVNAKYHFTNIVNPSTPGSYFVRLQTYATADTSGPASDYGGIAFAITNTISITAEVPPYLIFCTAVTIANLNCADGNGSFIDLGELSPSHASNGSSQMLVATNAQGGYMVTIAGATLTSGSNVINPLSTNDVSRPGTGQFGFNLRANATPKDGSEPFGPGKSQPSNDYSQANSYRFVPNDVIVTTPVPDDVRVFTSSYIINVPVTQAAGVYVTTITYVCLANF